MKSAPTQVSHYRLETKVGAGSMGTVYRGVDRRDGTLVAVKLLHEHLADDPAFRERFEQEAHVAAVLRSPYTVRILEYGESGGRYFIAMEYVHGSTLKRLINEAPFSPAQAMRTAAQVARALEEAEARGVVHRDIKPDNILVRRDGSVKVADFGVARIAGGRSHTGDLLAGTLAYAAPEQLAGQADKRSDVYALGATMYCMVAGAPPFAGDGVALANLIRTGIPPLQPLQELPSALRNVILRCLEKNPNDRYQSAVEVAAALTVVAQAIPDADAAEPTLPRSLPAETEGVSLELVSKRKGSRFGSSRYVLTVRNLRARAINVHLRAEEDDGRCAASLPEIIAVAASSSATIPVRVRPSSRRLRGQPETRIFTIYGSAGGDEPPVAVSGQFMDQPFGWLPAMGGASLLGAGCAIFGALWLAGMFHSNSAPERPLKIGVIMPTTGAFSDLGTAYLNSARMSAADINNQGGVLGRPVEIVAADSAGSIEDTAKAEARRLIDEEGVQAIITEDWDHLSWHVAQEVTGPKQVLQLSIGPAFKYASGQPDFYYRPVATLPITEGSAMAQLVRERGYKRVCSVVIGDVDDVWLRAYERFVAASPGIETVLVSFDGGKRESPHELKDRCAGVDATILFVYAAIAPFELPEPSQLIADIATGGFGDLLLVGELQYTELMNKVGWNVLDGVWGTTFELADERPYATFLDNYLGLFGALTLPEELRDFITVPYDSVRLIALAAEKAGTTDSSAMRGAIDDVANEPGRVYKPGAGIPYSEAKRLIDNGEDIDYEGVSGPIQFDKNGDNTRSIVGFWQVDAATHTFPVRQRFLYDAATGSLEELTPGD